MSGKKLITAPQIAERKLGGRHPRIVNSLIHEHDFPRPVLRGLYVEDEVDDWIDNLIARRDEQAA